MWFGILILAVALIISLSSAVYSILGLTAIFAAAFWPIVVMGGALELGKIVTTLWLHKYWHRAELQYKIYLTFAVAVLMALTSMGVFGFLSKAHTDQALVSGDVGAKIAIYDEKIKISRDNIDAARKALTQLDVAVDQTMARSNDERGAERAVQIRRQQQAERTRLLKEIEVEQKKIQALNEEAAPIRAEVRKVEAEVGPIKYIAALIYGDSTDSNLLEAAVRWVIILIVIVFDPLALVLLLAATKTFEWERGVDLFNIKRRQDEEQARIDAELAEANQKESDPDLLETDIQAQIEQEQQQEKERVKLERERNRLIKKIEGLEQQLEAAEQTKTQLKETRQSLRSANQSLEAEQAQTSKLQKSIDRITKSKETVEAELALALARIKELSKPADTGPDERPGDYITAPAETVTKPERPPAARAGNKYVPPPVPATIANPKLKAVADDEPVEASHGFGTQFPVNPGRGDTYLRVDYLPNRLYKYNGQKWMEIDKSVSNAYAYDEQYIKYLVDKLSSGEYTLDDLNPVEQDQVEQMLNQSKGKNE